MTGPGDGCAAATGHAYDRDLCQRQLPSPGYVRPGLMWFAVTSARGGGQSPDGGCGRVDLAAARRDVRRQRKGSGAGRRPE
jgi:hypothetical protein